jgi:hypothetical protein
MSEGSPAAGPPRPPDEAGPRRPLLSVRNLGLAGAALLVIIILIAALRYHSGSERRRYDAMLAASLDRLVTAQEGFFYDSSRYASSLRSLPTVKLPTGVNIQLSNPDRRSWWGVASHNQFPSRRCVVWVGNPPAGLPAEARAPEEETKPLCYDAAQLSALPVRRS